MKKTKKMRLPNGFGQITCLNNPRLRKPYRVMVTVGKNEKGRPISKLLKPQSYFCTYNDAYAALIEYHKNPFDIENDITLEALYERWYPDYKSGVSSSRLETITAAWNYCSLIKHMKIRDIRPRHIKGVLDEGCINIAGNKRYPGIHMKLQIKTLFNLLFDYALEYELVDKNIARTFHISKDYQKKSLENRKSHIIYNNEEIALLWDHSLDPIAASILIQCYTGFRPRELLNIRLLDVDFSDMTITGGMKTEAGKDRIVPIHPRIAGLVRMLYSISQGFGQERLIVCTESCYKGDRTMTYSKYRKRFKDTCKSLGLEPGHRPHDGRKHFVTMAKYCGVDEYVIKRLVGHAISDITEAVYTQRDLDWLRREMEKIL